VSRWPESLYYVTYRYTAPLCPRAHQPEGHAPERHRPVAAFKRLTLHMATTAWLFNPIIATHEPNQSRSSSYISRTAGYLGPSPTVEVRCCSKRSIVHSDYSPSNDLKPMTHRCLFHPDRTPSFGVCSILRVEMADAARALTQYCISRSSLPLYTHSYKPASNTLTHIQFTISSLIRQYGV
jgi:hypothetical protein